MIIVKNIQYVQVGEGKEIGRRLSKERQKHLVTQIRQCLQELSILAEYEVR